MIATFQTLVPTMRAFITPIFRIFSLCILQVGLAVNAQAQTWDSGAYIGWRAGLMNFKEVSVTKKQLSFRCDVANTGRLPLSLNPGSTHTEQVVFGADATLDQQGLTDLKEEIAAALVFTGVELPAGAVIRNRQFVLDRTTWQEMKAAAEVTRLNEQTDLTRFYFADTLLGCPDLVVDTIHIMGESKRQWELMVFILNKGTGPARLYDPTVKGSGLPISFFTGNTPHISRSSLFLQGSMLGSGLESTSGTLEPGASVKFQTSIPRREVPLHHHQIQVRLDTFQYVEECDETNNEYIFPFKDSLREGQH